MHFNELKDTMLDQNPAQDKEPEEVPFYGGIENLLDSISLGFRGIQNMSVLMPTIVLDETNSIDIINLFG
jgi:hypothetical protein